MKSTSVVVQKRAALIFMICILATTVSFNALSADSFNRNLELLAVTPGVCMAVAVDGDMAYMGAGAYLWVLDIADRSNPELLGSLLLPQVIKDIVVSNGYAFIREDYGALRIVDVSDPYAPYEVSSYVVIGGVRDFTVSGNYVYVSDNG